MNTRHQTRSLVRKFTIVFLLLTAACFFFNFTRSTEASNPPSGAISPSGPNVVWQAPLTGGTSANDLRPAPRVISYTDDHNDFDGNTYVTRQISGASINNEGTTMIPPPNEGASLPAKACLPADSPQVIDFAQDVQVGLLGVLPLNDALDVVSIKYFVRDEHEWASDRGATSTIWRAAV